LSPYPAAWTILKGKTLKVYKANVVEGIPQQSSGTTETDSKTYLYFHTGNGVLSLVDLQLEGKKRMGIEEFLRGYKF